MGIIRQHLCQQVYGRTDWGTAEIIDNDDVDASSPQIAVDTSGNAIAVWEQNGVVYANEFR